MAIQQPLDMTTRLAPYLPKAFQEGHRPYLFVLAWMAIILVSLLMVLDPSESQLIPRLGIVSLIFFEFLMLQFGASEKKAVIVVLAGYNALIIYLSLLTGGIFSPKLNWITLAPLVAFYVLGKKQGFIWLGLGIVEYLIVAWCTTSGLLIESPKLGDEELRGSFATYTATLLAVLLTPFLYNNMFRNTFKMRGIYNRQLKENQEELKRVSAARELFIATVSHELRTPMNAILGFNRLLMQQVQDKPDALKILQHTQQSADHLLTVINDVLDFSQLQAGSISIHPENFVLQDTIDSATGLFLQRLKSTQLDFQCTVDADVPQWVRTDRHRLMQILVNLLGNAIKFTHQGFVHMRVTQKDGGVMFSIKDSGIGIALELQPHIFERFSQGEEVQARFGGNGLGLSISKRLVELMGGKIGFESQQGHGAHFWFYLPLQAQAPQSVANVAPADLDVNTELAYRFLVVDDHPINRLLARQILQRHWKNSAVVEADNGINALTELKANRFDLVLMDMVMPEMDGIEATQRLRQELQGDAANIPVLGLTANVNPNDLERFAKAGVDDTVLKPFEQDKLCAQVQHLLNKKKSSQGS
ncbi:MAG: response regulator [Betaproteobacteria bacterium]|jgi:signal transduction histidine kinase/ActR/RegA family two-component response regulator|nr:response regulator [Betaproteobacteria bacterium]